MYVAEITFHLPAKAHSAVFQQALEHAVYGLLAAWQHSGRMEYGEASMLQLADRCVIYAHIPEPDALDAKLDKTATQEALQGLHKLTLAVPEVRVLGKAFAIEENCHCGKRDAYILYTTLFSRVSPLRCGNCFAPVPLYQIPPVSNDNYQRVLDWQSSYQACDTLNIESGSLEYEAQREMASFKSKLAKSGRAICRTIEKSTGVPTYYYLHEYKWRKEGEEQRHCPDCDNEWLLSEPWHGLFHYKCDSSRLLSNMF